MAHVICDTNGTHCDGLSGNKWIHAPYLLAGLFEVTPNCKGLPCRCLVECQHARASQKRFEPTILRSRSARSSKTNPNFYGSYRGDLERPARGSDNAIFEMAMTLFLVKDRGDDASKYFTS